MDERPRNGCFTKAKGEWVATVWYDEALRFPIHAVTAQGSIFDTDAIKIGKPQKSVFTIPSDYKKLGVTDNPNRYVSCSPSGMPGPCR